MQSILLGEVVMLDEIDLFCELVDTYDPKSFNLKRVSFLIILFVIVLTLYFRMGKQYLILLLAISRMLWPIFLFLQEQKDQFIVHSSIWTTFQMYFKSIFLHPLQIYLV